MNDPILEEVAQNISDKASSNTENENFGSIILTIMIIGIVLNLIRVVQECNNDNKSTDKGTADKIKNLCARKGWFTKMRIKKSIRQQIGTEKYKQYGKIILDAIMDTGENLTEEKLIKLVEASNNV